MAISTFKSVSFIAVFAILFNSPLTFFVSLSFNFPCFGSHDTNRFINATGDAYISNQGIQPTPNERSVSQIETVGRVTYIEPLHLWDMKLGNLNNFSTHFSFNIDEGGNFAFGDGIAFFFAPVYSSILHSIALGGSLGLNYKASSNASSEPFFAVEFDTFKNFLDPNFDSSRHVGVDISSMYSIAFAEWRNNFTKGRGTKAWIRYNGSSNILSVDFTGSMNNNVTTRNLTHFVDFIDFLPEKIVFGLSGSTGALFQINSVMSCEFSSNLQIDITPNASYPSPPPESVINTGGVVGKKWQRNQGLVAGLGGGLSVFLLLLAFVGCFLWKKKHNKLERASNGDTRAFDPSMDDKFKNGTGAKKFSYSELAGATHNFAENMMLGEGGFGEVYKGILKHDKN